MINQILQALSLNLRETFQNKYQVYLDTPEQGLTEPYFFIVVLKSTVSSLMGRRFMQHYPLDIQYISNAAVKQTELYAIAEQLMADFSFITLADGDKLHGTGMSYEIVDGILHVFVNFRLIMVNPLEETDMETVHSKVDI